MHVFTLWRIKSFVVQIYRLWLWVHHLYCVPISHWNSRLTRKSHLNMQGLKSTLSNTNWLKAPFFTRKTGNVSSIADIFNFCATWQKIIPYCKEIKWASWSVLLLWVWGYVRYVWEMITLDQGFTLDNPSNNISEWSIIFLVYCCFGSLEIDLRRKRL